MLLSCGDALIDFVPVKAADGRDAYVPAVGGSCLNVAVAMARLDAPAGLVAGISTDLFGAMIADHAAASNVSLAYASRSPDETTLAFVRFIDGEPHYAFYDEATAARRWEHVQGSIPFSIMDALHVGSTTLIREPGSSRALALVDEARQATTISFDPNCRPSLIADRADYVARMVLFAGKAHIVRMSDVDFDYLFGGDDHAGKADELLSSGVSLFVVTRGGEGVLAFHPSAGRVEVAAPKVAVADTIGAGDTFQGALLVALRELDRISRDRLPALTAGELARALGFAAECAAITCSRPGADPPWRREVSFPLP